MMHFAMWAFWLVVAGLLVAIVVLLVRKERSTPAGSIVASGVDPGGDEVGTATSDLEPPGADRSLDQDEKAVYDLVFESEDSVYQKDLPERSGFSKAKVSRVLDRLERKGLVVRVSHGMTNRIELVNGTRS